MITYSAPLSRTFAIAFFLSLAVVLFIFTPLEFSIGNVSDLYFSEASKEGVDITKRVGFFYRALLLLSACFTGFYLCFSQCFKKRYFNSGIYDLLAVLSVFGLACAGSFMLGYSSRYWVLLFCSLIFTTGLISWLSSVKQLPRVFNVNQIYTHHLLSSISLVVVFIHVFNDDFSLYYFINVYLVLYVLGILLNIVCVRYMRFNQRNILACFSSFSLFGLSAVLAWEIFFLCGEPKGYPPNGITFILFLVTAVPLFFKLKRINIAQQVNRFLAPLTLLSVLLFVFYQPIIRYSVDMFELANPAIAQMKVFVFGKIPLAQFMSSHMLSEQLPGYIYNSLFGYMGTQDFLIYNFFYPVLAYGCVYMLLKKVLNPVFAFGFLFFFPFYNIFFYQHLIFGVLVFHVALTAFRRSDIQSFILFYITLTISVLWRIDFGVSMIFSGIIFLFLLFICNKRVPSLKVILGSIVIFFGGLLVVVTLFGSTLGWQFLQNNFLQAFGYVGASQAHGYSSMGKVNSHHFALFHYFLPLASFALIAWLVVFYVKFRSRISEVQRYILMAAVFFFLVHLGNFSRALVRHNFMESLDTSSSSTFYLAGSLALLALHYKGHIVSRFKWFFISAWVFILLFKYFDMPQQKSFASQMIANQPFNWRNNLKDPNREQRVIYPSNLEDNKKQLNQFLKENLKENQTFLDFSNTPMLYYELQRSQPSYFCQGLQHLVSEDLQLRFLNRLGDYDVPFVVYSNNPRTFWDATDDVENELRYAAIAEFIYRNYDPLGIVGSHYLWQRKGIEAQSQIIDPPLPDVFEYKELAYLVDRFYAQNEYQNMRLIERSIVQGQYFEIPVSWSRYIRSKTVYLQLLVREPAEDKACAIKFIGSDGNEVTVRYQQRRGQKRYMIRLSNIYEFYRSDLNRIELDNTCSCSTISLWQRDYEN